MSSNLADYDPNAALDAQRKKQQPPAGAPPGGNLADAFGAQMPASTTNAAPPPSIPAPTGGGMPAPPAGQPPVIGRPTEGGMPNPTLPPTTPAVPIPQAAASGAKRETMGGMNGVRLANGDWLPADHPGAIAAIGGESQAVYPGGAPAPAAAPPPGAAPAPAPGAAPGTPAAPGAPQGPGNAYQDALLKMLGDSQTPASLNDPALKAQSDAYAVGQKRGAERDRAAAAEMASMNGTAGLSSGAFDSDVSGINERAGENMAGFNAGIVGDANKQKLGQMQNALAMMGADKNSAEGRALQERIATMQNQLQRDQMAQQDKQFGTDADLRRLGITTQADLGGRDLSLRDKLGSGGLNLGLLQSLMQNDQFGKGLGAQLGMFGANQNQQALLSLLGGL